MPEFTKATLQEMLDALEKPAQSSLERLAAAGVVLLRGWAQQEIARLPDAPTKLEAKLENSGRYMTELKE